MRGYNETSRVYLVYPCMPPFQSVLIVETQRLTRIMAMGEDWWVRLGDGTSCRPPGGKCPLSTCYGDSSFSHSLLKSRRAVIVCS